jgi:hypothetical protein
MNDISNDPIPITNPENEGSYGITVSDLICASTVIVAVVIVGIIALVVWLIP